MRYEVDPIDEGDLLLHATHTDIDSVHVQDPVEAGAVCLCNILILRKRQEFTLQMFGNY